MYMYSYLYPYYGGCVCQPEFYTAATDDVYVSVLNDTQTPVVVLGRSFGAWGCNQDYEGNKYVCYGKVIAPGTYNNFFFDSRGHCKSLAIQYPARGPWYYYPLDKKEQLKPAPAVPPLNQIKMSTIKQRVLKNDFIGPLGCVL